MAENIERELSWDESIENDGPEFVLLPDGEYPFRVEGLERKRFNGSDKLPACPMAELKIRVFGDNNQQALLTHRLYLHTRTEGLLCAFFTAIGQRKHGEKLTPKWQSVVGSEGRCKIGQRTYNGNQYNDIKGFVEPSEQKNQNVGGWGNGAF